MAFVQFFTPTRILLLLFVVAIVLVNPMGNFPLNDDWAYAHNTYALALENRWEFSDWPAMTLVAHTLWGTLFCKVFGASFTVLRFSTLLLAASGVVAFQRILSLLNVDSRTALFYGFLLLFNPLWFVLAHSYMTDVPFLSVFLWALFFFFKTVESPRVEHFLPACFFALWACMIRQLGLVLPLAFGVVFLYQHRWSLRNLLFALSPFALCYLAVAGLETWLRSRGQLPESYTGLKSLLDAVQFNEALGKTVAKRGGIILLTMGLFLLPGVMAYRKGFAQGWGFGRIMPALVVSFLLFMGWSEFPTGNVFYNLGLGPVVLKGIPSNHLEIAKLSAVGLFCIRLLAATGAILLLIQWRQASESGNQARSVRMILWILIGCFALFNCLNWIMIDRYLLMFVPLMLLLLAIGQSLPPSKFSWAMAFMLSLFSIAATHDYLAWNRARHQGLHDLLAQGVSPKEIDGGFEFNGFYKTGPKRSMRGQKSWWFVRDDEWVASLGSLYGYDLVRAMPYQRWLPPSTDSILIQRRKATVLRDSLYCDMEQISTDSSVFLPNAGRLQPGNVQTRSAKRSRSGAYSAQLDWKNAFGLSLALEPFERHERFVAYVWRYPAVAEAGFIIAANDAESFWFSEGSYLIQRDSAGWGLLEMDVYIPEKAVGQAGKLYLWNPSEKDTVWFDDFKLYRRKALE